ncbi:hypothetical protein MNV_1550004 [Candidatus Methanoperedens nitroreducens]|uniref:Uncharacterized protein n=1 Tax=Candidatus Methanoperedens nitratireducens TaxID=1392998 RepID=A0A284VL82_9EURY|nr:hypothetical protein MNV_1550004 [Candidatus Methanoperedens nitroreducens]
MIDGLNQFYNDNSNLINLISILFGIAGTVIGIITWRDSKKSKKSYEYLFELVYSQSY